MSRRTQALAALLLLGVGAAGCAWFGQAWYRAQATNRLIRAADAAAIGERAPPAARFAKAYALRQAGQPKAAGAIYRELLVDADPALALPVHYNLANLYFLQAAVAADETRLRDVVPLVMRARRHYQRVLYLDPGHYDGKYNLEYVERLMQSRDWDADQTKLGATARRSEGGTGWVSVHELPEGLP